MRTSFPIILCVLGVLGVAPAVAVDVTVYNQNLGLIRETRPFALKAGVSELRVTEVAAQIDPTSVHFKSLTAPDSVSVLEQDFQYDLVSREKLLQKYLGKEIELERFLGQDAKPERIKGTLLSADAGGILRVGEKVYVSPPGNPILPDLPEGLLTKPALVWKLQSEKSGTQDCEISYLTAGMGWRSDYVLVTNADDTKLDLNAWVTIDNNSGATYKDAKLKLVAGDVHRAPEPEAMEDFEGVRKMAAPMAASAAAFQEKSFFEYHMYTLQRPATLREFETKQIEMASAAEVPVQKKFIYDGAQGMRFWGGLQLASGYGQNSQPKVSVSLEFKNSKANHMGMPLPKGRIRVYKKDTDGSLAFIGEDAIDHTPKDEVVRVQMGNAFDVVGERKRTDFQSEKQGKTLTETYEVKLRNHKDEAVTVTVVEHLFRWSSWKITDSSQKYRKQDAQTIEFDVQIPKDGEAVVTYTARYTW